LVPEIGDTITAGVIYSPSWLDGFHLSVDYWHIKVTNQIITPGAQTIVNNCLEFHEQSYCPAIQYSAVTGNIAIIASEGFNAALLETDGWDFEAGYQFDMGSLVSGWNGTIQAHALLTYMGDYVQNQFGVVTNTAGSENTSIPRLRSNINLIYLNDPWTISVNGDWVGGGPLSALYNTSKYTYAQGGRTINNNYIDGEFMVNLSVSYQLTDAWQVYGRFNNLFNHAPSIVPDTTTFQHANGNALFDHIGGTYLFGVKLSLD